jgi:hypothetical protein
MNQETPIMTNQTDQAPRPNPRKLVLPHVQPMMFDPEHAMVSVGVLFLNHVDTLHSSSLCPILDTSHQAAPGPHQGCYF